MDDERAKYEVPVDDKHNVPIHDFVAHQFHAILILSMCDSLVDSWPFPWPRLRDDTQIYHPDISHCNQSVKKQKGVFI